MTDPKESGKPIVKKREPKKVTSTGIFDNLRKLPEPHPVEEILGLAQSTQPNPSQPIPTHPKSLPGPGTSPTKEAAPARDFNRRANSLERHALPSGMFPGTSKKLYDALYLRTRGAVVPVRTIQATKRQLMDWSGIRSKNTIAVNLQLLTNIGLIVRQLELGDHEGSVYEVRLPEELDPTQPNPTQPNPTQKLGGDPTQFLGWVGLGNPVDSKGTSANPKTSFKTNTNDDDERHAFSDLNSIFHEATQKLTGRPPKTAEREQWAEVARVIVAELNSAAGRAGTVSSVPAFLAAHLSRKFAQKPTQRRGEEKQTPSRVEVNQLPPAHDKRLTVEEISEQARLIMELLEGGYTIEQAEAQFRGSFHTEDWESIRKLIATS